MKSKNIHIILILITIILFIVSCNEDDESSFGTPQVVFDVDYQPIVRPNDTLIVTPSIYKYDSPQGCFISSVKYYWDNVLIESSNSSPFTLQYKVPKEKGINHRLVMEIGVGGKGYKDSIYTRRYDVFVGDYGSYELIKPDKKEFKQNETITFVSYWIDDNIPQNDKHIIKIYWDGKLIAETDKYVLTCNYSLFSEDSGTHEISFSYERYYKSDFYPYDYYCSGASGPSYFVHILY